MDKFSFEELNVYKYARALVRSVYKIIQELPSVERHALADQLRRAVISVPSNIAEGMSRKTAKQQQHFIEISYGSLMEVLCQLQLAKDLNYISQQALEGQREHIVTTAKLLSGLHASLNSKSMEDDLNIDTPPKTKN